MMSNSLKVTLPILLFVTMAFSAYSQTTDTLGLYGIYWYGKTDSIDVGELTDVEDMSSSKSLWIMEITHVDPSQGPAWQHPPYYVGHCEKASSGKGHSFIFRVQPYWRRNVPHADDPYTLENYADDAKSAAETLKDYVHVWQVGNEINIRNENHSWSGSSYSVIWEPEPEQYSATYVAVRDKIHDITPSTTSTLQTVLMAPVSPGNVIPDVRFMDGNEFLWRQIEGVSDKSKIDGFAIEGYAEPGGTNWGVDAFLDTIREQIMIIDQLGLYDRPIYITEWNKHMPDAAEAAVGAKFLHRAYAQMNDWNTGTGGAWPELTNHNIVAATWFVYPKGYNWDDYSLQDWKSKIASTDKDANPWHSFKYAVSQNYSAGISGGGEAVLMDEFWWEDTFDGEEIDETPPLPDWKVETTGSGSVEMTGDGQVRLLGNNSQNGGGGIRTSGYVYGDFRLETDIEFTVVDWIGNSAEPDTRKAVDSEIYFDLRLREGSKGYSISFFPASADPNANRIILRRTNDWTQIGTANVLVPDGILSGDRFHVSVIASGSNLDIKITKNDDSTPIVNWSVIDHEQNVGWIRLMTYNMNEARVDYVRLGGPQWDGTSGLGVSHWWIY